MGIIKLVEAGESLTATVTKAERVKGNYGEQVRFTVNGDDLYVPLDSALRQLERIPLGVEECVGETLVFSRDPNPKPGSKPYWGIRVAGAAQKAQAANPSKRLSYTEAQQAAPTPAPRSSAAPNASDKLRVARAYLDLFGYVKSQPEMQGVGADVVQSAAATIWIEWGKQGFTKAEPLPAPKPAPKPEASQPTHDFSDFPPEPVEEDLPF